VKKGVRIFDRQETGAADFVISGWSWGQWDLGATGDGFGKPINLTNIVNRKMGFRQTELAFFRIRYWLFR